MTVDEILNEWDKDSVVDPLHIEEGLANISRLHAKYLRLWAIASREATLIEIDLKNFIQLKTCWYGPEGLSKEELTDLGWEPRPKVVIRLDMERYLDGDQEVIKKKLRFASAKLKVNKLTFILKEINNRNWHYSRIIELRKFEAAIN